MTQKLTVGSLFAGIGGIELGLEWTGGFETVWQVENDRYATQVLERHWPHVRRWGDIKAFNSCLESIATLSPVAFPVRTLAMLDNVPALPEPVRDSGGKWCKPFAWYDQSTCLWRTWQRCFIEGWARFSGTWPRAGMTRNGIAYRRPHLDYQPSALASSCLPTPRWTDGKGQYVATLKTSLKRVRKESAGQSYRAHWIHVVLLLKNLKKGWANPRFSELLQGFPLDWSKLDLDALETQ